MGNNVLFLQDTIAVILQGMRDAAAAQSWSLLSSASMQKAEGVKIPTQCCCTLGALAACNVSSLQDAWDTRLLCCKTGLLAF